MKKNYEGSLKEETKKPKSVDFRKKEKEKKPNNSSNSISSPQKMELSEGKFRNKIKNVLKKFGKMMNDNHSNEKKTFKTNQENFISKKNEMLESIENTEKMLTLNCNFYFYFKAQIEKKLNKRNTISYATKDKEGFEEELNESRLINISNLRSQRLKTVEVEKEFLVENIKDKKKNLNENNYK